MTNEEVEGTHTHRSQIAANAEVQATVPPDRSAVAVPDDPEAARAEIEMTRARMSETIDEIEGALLRKKEQIQDRLDVFGPVRERPLPSVGVVFGAGLLLGLLTGGDDEDDYEDEYASDYEYRGDDRYRGRLRELEERADTWEHRARQLLHIAREQEEELDRLSGGRHGARDDEWDEEGEHDDGPSAFDGLRDKLVGGMTGFVAHAVQDLIRSTVSGRPS